MNRRTFLKTLGVGAAPLFVPADRLDFGVPTQRLVTTASMSSDQLHRLWKQQTARTAMLRDRVDTIRDQVPMLLLQSEFMIDRGKLPAGTELHVDLVTAERWARNGVAVPGPTAPKSVQELAAFRALERKKRDQERAAAWLDHHDPIAERAVAEAKRRWAGPYKMVSVVQVGAGWERMMAAARADGLTVS